MAVLGGGARAVDPSALSEAESRGTRLARSVFLMQLSITASLTAVIIVAVAIVPSSGDSPMFTVGLGIVYVVSVFAVVVPWGRVPTWWIAVLPVADIVAIGLIRIGEPLLGVGVFFVFPIIWLATHFGLWGAVVGPALSSALMIGATIAEETPAAAQVLARVVVIPIVLTFVSAVTYATARRSRAQRRLLLRQSAQLGAALEQSAVQRRVRDAVLNAVPFMVLCFDADGRITFANSPYRDALARYGARDDNPMMFRALYAADRSSEVPDRLRPGARVARGEQVDGELVWLSAPDVEPRSFIVSSRHLSDDRGEDWGAVLIWRDVTNELQAISARDDLVSSVSHELRTPLTSIIGYLDLVDEDERIGDESRRMLGVATRNAERMLTMVADLLTASKDQQSQILITPARMDLAEVVQAAVESASPVARELGIALATGGAAALPVSGDAFRLRQVIDNLLSNAVKYNAVGGTVVVSLAVVGDEATVAVRDTGRGMSTSDVERLFTRFFRSEDVRGSSVHGTGLGLNISRDIVRRHGGDIDVDSVLGRGTTMTVRIPRADTAQED